MPYDTGLVERIDDALRGMGQRAVRQKNVFGGRGFLAGSSTFVIVFDDDLIVKTAADEYQAALAEPGVTPFAPDGEHSMGTWVVVRGDSVADDPELAEWVGRGLRGIGRR
jgi:TfoX/Sxy family transcriptional regulator of competence genes